MPAVTTMAERDDNLRSEHGATQKYYGKYPGTVVGNAARTDLKDYGNHRGELLVEVPMILIDDPDGSARRPLQVWARPCFPAGFFFLPAVGDSIWVEFVAGNLSDPVWTGVWYPKDKAPQTAAGQPPTEGQQLIRTPQGHMIELDASGKKLVIQDWQGNQVIVDDTGVTITSKAIKLGSGTAGEPLVLGNKWLELFNKHTHMGNMGAPTSPPAGTGTMATGAELSKKHKTE